MAQNIEFTWKFNNSDLDSSLSKWRELNKEVAKAAANFDKFNKAAKSAKAPDTKEWKATTQQIQSATQALMRFHQTSTKIKAPNVKGWEKLAEAIRVATDSVQKYNAAVRSMKTPNPAEWRKMKSDAAAAAAEVNKFNKVSVKKGPNVSVWEKLAEAIRSATIALMRYNSAARNTKQPDASGWKKMKSDVASATSEVNKFNKASGKSKGPSGKSGSGSRGPSGGGGGGNGPGGGFGEAFGKAGEGAGNMAKGIGEAIFKGTVLGAVIGGGVVAGIEAAITAITSFVSAVFKATAESQKLKSQLAVLFTKDTGEAAGQNIDKATKMAEKTLRALTELGAQTPYETNELTQAYVKLTAAGMRPAKESLVALGDIASFTGKKIDQVVEAVIDAQRGEKGRLNEVMMNMEQKGKKMEVSLYGTKVAGEKTLEVFTKLGQSKGISGAMLEQSKTLGGVMSTAKDNLNQFLTKVGESALFANTFGAAFSAMGVILEVISRGWDHLSIILTTVFAPVLQTIKEQFGFVGDALNNTGGVVNTLSKYFNMFLSEAVGLLREHFIPQIIFTIKWLRVVWDTLVSLWAIAKPILLAMYERFVIIQKVVFAFKRAIFEMAGGMIAVIGALIQKIANLVSGSSQMSKAGEHFQVFASYVRATAMSVIQIIEIMGKTVGGFLTSIAEFIKTGSTQGFTDLLAYVKKAPGAIMKAWEEGKKSKGMSFGQDLVSFKAQEESGFESPTDTKFKDKDDDKKKKGGGDDAYDLEMARLKQWHQDRLFEIDESMGAEKKTEAENLEEILWQEVEFMERKFKIMKKFNKMTKTEEVEWQTELAKLHQDFQMKEWEREYDAMKVQAAERKETDIFHAMEEAIYKKKTTEELEKTLHAIHEKYLIEEIELMKTYGKLSDAEAIQKANERIKNQRELEQKLLKAEEAFEEKRLEASNNAQKFAIEKRAAIAEETGEITQLKLLRLEEAYNNKQHNLKQKYNTLSRAEEEEYYNKRLEIRQNFEKTVMEIVKNAGESEKKANRERLERTASAFDAAGMGGFGEMIKQNDDYKNKIKETTKELENLKSALAELTKEDPTPEMIEKQGKLKTAIKAVGDNLGEIKIEKIMRGVSKALEGIGQASKIAADATDKVFESQINQKDKQLAMLDAEEAKLKKIVDQEEKRAEVLSQQQGIINAMAEQRIKELEYLTETVPEAEKARVQEDIDFEKQRIKAVESAKENAASAEKNRLKRIEADKAKVEKQKQKLQEKQFEVQRAASITQALIAGAIGSIAAWTQVPFVLPVAIATQVAVGITTAASVAAIASQPNPFQAFKDGSLFVDKPGAARNKDSVPAMLMPGEAVIPVAQNKAYQDTIAAIYRQQIPPEVINGFVRDFRVANIDPTIFNSNNGPNLAVMAGLDTEKIVNAIREKETMSVNIDNDGFHAYIESHNLQTIIRDKKLRTRK